MVTELVSAWEPSWPTKGGLALAALLLPAGIGYLVYRRTVSRRRIRAMKLGGFGARRRATADGLSFYLTMLDLLGRRGFKRPSWQGPYAFATALAQQDARRFSPAVALTELFYEVRFGGCPLDIPRRARISQEMKRLRTALSHPAP